MPDYKNARRGGDDPKVEEAAKAEQPGLAQASVTGESGLAGQQPQPGKSESSDKGRVAKPTHRRK